MSFFLWTLWTFLQIATAPTVPRALPAHGTIPPAAPPMHGAPTVVGEEREVCDDETTTAHATILDPAQDWEHRLVNAAQPGDIFLLRAGVYQARAKLRLPAGTAEAPILIKPYACATVTLRGSLRPNSHNTIAGLRIEATGIDDTKWAIRVDGKNNGPRTAITIRNNTIVGGSVDAVRLDGAVRHVLIQGNHIDGGAAGHDLFVTAATRAGTQTPLRPSAITITQNLLTKEHYSAPSEDMFQARAVGTLRFTHNSCANGHNMEQCIDIKSATVPLVIAHNLLAGNTLHRAGRGEDGSGGCMVIHERDGVAEQHLIEHNYFYHCRGTVVRFATDRDPTESSALFQYNLLIQQKNHPQVIAIARATDLQFRHNTVLYGVLKLGHSSQAHYPHALTIEQNIFFQTRVENHPPATGAAYSCAYNLFYQPTGTWLKQCRATISQNPRFVSAALNNFHLQTGSPALTGGANGTTIGALSTGAVPIALDQFVYLPMVTR